MKQRFLQLEPRQQLIALLSATALVTVLVATGLWQLHQRQQTAAQQLAQTAAQLAEVQTLATHLVAIHEHDRPASNAPVDIIALINHSLQSAGLQPSRMQQNSAEELQLRLDAVSFADVIAWLAALEQQGGVVLLRATFSPATAGKVTVAASLRRSP